jgi:Tol biopolymer transport system component
MRTLALLSILLLSPQAEKVSFDEKILATIGEGVTAKDIVFFKDGRQVAFRAIGQGKMWVQVNNTKQADYQGIAEGLSFSPDGKVVYRANNGGTWLAIVGGAPAGPGMLAVGIPAFSPDGKKMAYDARRATSARTDATSATVFVGGQKEGEWAGCGPCFWSGDGSTVAHQVRIGKPGTPTRPFHTVDSVCVGGKPGPEYDHVSNPYFAPKGKMMAYKAQTGPTWAMVVDGKPQDSYPDVGEPHFSDDGKGIAYRAGTSGKYNIIINGKKSSMEYQSVSDPSWSPDNKTVTFVVTDEKGEYIVYGEQKTETYSRVYPPVFSADGTHMAFGARSTNGKYMVVMDDKSGPAEFEAIGTMVISPDGKHVAFAGQWNFRWSCVVDHGRGSPHDVVNTPVWSPDSKKVAYAGQTMGKWFWEINYRRDDGYDEVLSAPVFSSDGKRAACGVRRGNDLLWRVVQVAD